MSDSFSDERADMATNTHLVVVSDGDTVPLPRNDMYLRVRLGATSTGITLPPAHSSPPNLRVTLDNTGGTGVLTVNGGEVQVPPGLVYVASVAGDGLGSQTYVVAGPAESANTLTSGATIQAAIDSDKENNRRLNLPAGEITYTSTLVIDNGSGGHLFGMGKPEPIAIGDTDARLGSTLIYNGVKTGTSAAITYERTDFIMRDLVLQGKATQNVIDLNGTNTPRGIHVTRGPNVGTGKLEVTNVRFSGFDYAIVCGEEIDDDNCDESHYYSVFSHHNGTFFQARSAQTLGHYFWGLRVGLTDTVFDCYGGGKIEAHCVDILSPTTLLRLRADEPDGYGQNFSKWTFRSVNLDAAAINTRLLVCDAGVALAGTNIRFDGVHLSMNDVNGWSNELVNVGDNMIVQINDATNICAGAIRWNTTQNESIVHIRNSRVWTTVEEAADLFDAANSTGNLRCIVENCYQHHSYALLNSGTLYNEVLAGT